MHIFTDASGFTGAGYCVEVDYSISHAMWSGADAGRSSTGRELKAVENTLISFSTSLYNKAVLVCTDNQNVPRILEKDICVVHYMK